MATYTIKKGKTRSSVLPRFSIGATYIRHHVTFTRSCVHDVTGAGTGYVFGIRGYARSVAFVWEYDHNFHVISLSVEKFDNGETTKNPIGFIAIGESIKMDIVCTDDYVVLSISDNNRILNSRFLPFKFLEARLVITPTFPVKAPHDIKIEMK